MKEITSIILVLVSLYLLFAAFLYVYQRKLIYYPMPVDPEFEARDRSLPNTASR